MTEKVAAMIEDFPFDLVAERMKETKWKWTGNEQPTPMRLREKAIWLYRTMESQQMGNIYSGGIGFEIVNGPSKIVMRFGKGNDIWFERTV